MLVHIEIEQVVEINKRSMAKDEINPITNMIIFKKRNSIILSKVSWSVLFHANPKVVFSLMIESHASINLRLYILL